MNNLYHPACTDDAQTVTISGYPVAFPGQHHATRFLLASEPPCCPGCAPRDSVVVEARAPVSLRAGFVRLAGILRPGPQPRLVDARLLEPPGWIGLTRRRAIVAGPLVCLGVAAARADDDAARAAIKATTAVDLHSHAGGFIRRSTVLGKRGFRPVAEPMIQGGMAVACLAVVSDSPTHRVMADNRIHPYRNPDPGELYTYGMLAFGRLHDMATDQGLAVIKDAAGFRAARAGVASTVISAEGGDFLEGQVDRVDEAYTRWTLRHLQLTHYRVNELGDIQTEDPVHGGLTDTGAEVIRRCNRLGIVVDVAHGTFDLVKRAAVVTSRPLVLSHTALTTRPRPHTRWITPDHARLVAGTGGVIGVWPPMGSFPTLDALAAGMARMVDVAGIDHVGLGSDMEGLIGASIFPGYEMLPGLAAALLRAGFSREDTGKLLGGNYGRVFEACMVPA